MFELTHLKDVLVDFSGKAVMEPSVSYENGVAVRSLNRVVVGDYIAAKLSLHVTTNPREAISLFRLAEKIYSASGDRIDVEAYDAALIKDILDNFEAPVVVKAKINSSLVVEKLVKKISGEGS